MIWNPKIIEKAFQGSQNAERLNEALNSFYIKNLMANYHTSESDRIIKELLASINEINKNDTSSMAVAKAILLAASNEKIREEVSLSQFKAEAHIIASAQSTHSLCDILANIIYFSLQLDSQPNSPPEQNLNLYSINRKLKNSTQYSTIQKLIDQIINSPEFLYLAAYTNTTKHKSLIPSSLSASFIADKKNGLRIKKFSYTSKGNVSREFDRKWSHDFLMVDNYNLVGRLLEIIFLLIN